MEFLVVLFQTVIQISVQTHRKFLQRSCEKQYKSVLVCILAVTFVIDGFSGTEKKNEKII